MEEEAHGTDFKGHTNEGSSEVLAAKAGHIDGASSVENGESVNTLLKKLIVFDNIHYNGCFEDVLNGTDAFKACNGYQSIRYPSTCKTLCQAEYK